MIINIKNTKKILLPALCLISCLYHSLATASDTSKANERFFEAIRNPRDIKLVQYLINAGADINARNNVGNTPLISAALWENVPAVKALIAAGADIHARNNKGMTARDVAWSEFREYSKIPKSEYREKNLDRYIKIVHILTKAGGEFLGIRPL